MCCVWMQYSECKRKKCCLLSFLTSFYRQAAKREVRTTVGAVAGEVDAADLLKRIGSTHLKKANKRTKTLPKPLEKHVVQRVCLP